ncbi:DUF6932 family protein [Rhodococcus aetherivorans]
MLPAVDDQLVLPPGRFRATLPEVKSHWGFNQHRVTLFENFETFIEQIRQLVRVSAVWLSGSYLSEKETPGDVDAVFLIDQEQLNRITDQRIRHILTPDGLRWLANSLGFQLDLYVLPWQARTSLDLKTPIDKELMQARGYWDDFWQRKRQVPKGTAPTRECALPSRGYVEVIIDGFQ